MLGLSKKIIQPLTSLTLLTLMTVTCPSAGMAQLPATKVADPVNRDTKRAQPEVAYSLGSGDRIRIDILQVPQYSGEHEVLVNGSLNLPQVGSVSVQGMTLKQAAEKIAAQYESARILRKPRVTVSLVTPRPLKIGIAGEVNRPGSYTMTLEGSQFPTLTRALEIAGGITQAADLRNAQVRRPQRSGSEQVLNVDLWQLLQTGDLRNDITLRDGDTIFIPTTTNIHLAEGRQLAAASFSVDRVQPINIAILGEVREPGTHTVTGEGGPGGLPTVTQAIEVAGGIKPLADISRIQIRRSTKTGSEQTIEVDLMELLQAADLQQDLILQDGDAIFIPTATDINLAEISQLRTASFAPDETQPLNVAIIGEVFRPGPHTVTGSARTGEAGIPGATNDAGSLPTVTRAIQVAGGIKPLADIRQIQIRRFTSTGSEKTIEIDLWKLLQAGDLSQDIVLQEGDTIFVPTATELDLAEATQIAAASFSPDTIRVNVVGEIKNPGIIEIPPNTPLNQALLAAGGFTNRSNSGSAELIRLNPNGTVSRQKVSLNFNQGVNEKTNPPLRNNDVLIVGRNAGASISDTLGTILSPLGSFLSIFTIPDRVIRSF